VKIHTLPLIENRKALTKALNPSAVYGMTMSFSPFSWAVTPPGQVSRNQTRKERTSLTPVIKMGLLLGSCLAGKQVLATWACGVVPSGLSLRGPDMSSDMRLLYVSDETASSDWSEPMAVGLIDPLG
jgi:hypothetical protein